VAAAQPVVSTASHGSPVLDVRGLHRRFRDRDVVRSLDLTMGPGDRVALRGPNGSGKTTVLRCVTGALTPSGGQVRVGGHPAGTEQAKQLVGASLSQERSFYLRLTGHENLRFFAGLRHDAGAVDRVRALEQELEIAAIAAMRLDRCSTGMLQQLSFARALLGEPRLLVLDEPTRSLDEGAVGRLWAAIERRPETAVLVATHIDGDLDHCHARIDLPV
jgi:ABC-2 type transport system ATP-binding protein